MHVEPDTIAAIATPPGRGAIAIVRASGAGISELASKMFRSRHALTPRTATYGEILDADGKRLDRCLALLLLAPRTYTGEDTLEFHVHGSPAIAAEVLHTMFFHGARLAGPGEFTRRAFLNGKMDLSEAEAVADLIAAENRSAARAAVARLSGALHDAIGEIRSELSSVLEELAAAIDFPDEVAAIEPAALSERLTSVVEQLQMLRRGWEVGRLVREGVTVAIVGPPNAGKSSLFNALLREDRVLVSEQPGTTRDTVEEHVAIDGVSVRLIDTAGIRAAEDVLERAGVERTNRALAGARIALVVIDASAQPSAEAMQLLSETRGRPRVVLYNKADLGEAAFAARAEEERDALLGSVRANGDVEAVRRTIARVGWGGEIPDLERPSLGTARELDAVGAALASLANAQQTLSAGDPPDLVCSDLRAASAALAQITGEAASEELLDNIFARFCIGK